MNCVVEKVHGKIGLLIVTTHFSNLPTVAD